MVLETLLVTGMFGAFIGLMLLGIPVAFVLAGVAFWFAILGEVLSAYGVPVPASFNYLQLSVRRVYGVMNSWTLVAVPMFVLMGQMLDKSGVAERLLETMQTLLRSLRGSLAISVMVMGILLAASTGIVGASVTLLATIALPTMLRLGYQPEVAVGTVTSAGTLGILVPPSIMLLIMADKSQISAGSMFMGAIFPGLILGALYVIFLISLAWFQPDVYPASSNEPFEKKKQLLLQAAGSLMPPVALIVLVLGSIFFGVATPTEASGLGAFGAFVIAALNKRITVGVIKDAVYATGRLTTFIFAIVIAAVCFSVILRGVGGDQVFEAAILGAPVGPYVTVGVIATIVFLMGFVLDWIEISVILLPMMVPILPVLDIDPVWFTVLIAVCLQTSFLTPPFGYSLFYLKAVAPPEVTWGVIYRGVIPFVVIQIIGVSIVFAFPELVLWLPEVAYS